MFYITIDPGHTTGVCSWVNGNLINAQQLTTEGSLGLTDMYDWLTLQNEQIRVDTVYSESFRLYAHKAKSQVNSSFQTVKVIGVIELWCEHNDVKFVENSAAFVKSIWTDEKLRKHGLYKIGSPHAMDALRHMLTVTKHHQQLGSKF